MQASFIHSPEEIKNSIKSYSLLLDDFAWKPQNLSQFALPTTFDSFCEKRKMEFLAGRVCALKAIEDLKIENRSTYIELNKQSLPVWPAGVVGSITHSRGLVRAAAANRKQYRSLGIDSEKIPLPTNTPRFIAKICTHGEWENLQQQTTALNLSQQQLLGLIFSAKESIFKCLHPLTQVFFGFQDAALCKISRDGCFAYQLRKNLSPEFDLGFTGTGAFTFSQGYVHTTVFLTEYRK